MLPLYFWLPNHNIPSWIFIPWIQDYSFQVYFTYVPQISKAKLNFFTLQISLLLPTFFGYNGPNIHHAEDQVIVH